MSAAARDRADPVVGWRYWQLAASGRLRSVTQKWVEWAPGEPLRSRCLEIGHPSPAEGCNCGVYGMAELEHLRQHGLCLVPGVPIVVGTVALWGRVCDDGGSWRGELGQPASLSLVADTVPDGRLAATLDGLAAYGVPVGTVTLDEAVAGASAAMLRFQAMSARASGGGGSGGGGGGAGGGG